MIPNKIHYIRLLSDGPISDFDQYCISKTQHNNKDFQVKVWSEDDVPPSNLTGEKLRNYVKFYVLHQEGGFIINNDNIFLQDIPKEWMDFKLFCSLEHEWELSSKVLGGVKSSRFFREGLNQMTNNTFTNLDDLVHSQFGRNSIVDLSNGKYKTSFKVKFIDKPKIYPHIQSEGIDGSNLILVKYWDNYTSTKDNELDVTKV